MVRDFFSFSPELIITVTVTGSMTKTIPKRELGVEDRKRKEGKAASQEVRGTERRDINEIKMRRISQ